MAVLRRTQARPAEPALAAAAEPSGPPLDPAVLAELAENTDVDFVRQVIDTYLEDSPQLLAALRQALAGGDAETARRAVHSLKSNSASVGAGGLAEQAREAEQLAKAGDLAAVAGRQDGLAAEFARVAAALKAWPNAAE